VHKTGAAAPEGQEFTIAGLAPSRAQKRLALGVFIVLLTGLALPMGEFGSVQLARLHALVPVYAGGERVLRVRSDNDAANNVTILVEDSGRGVESTDMDDIFNPLFTTKSQGMGLGLTICRSIVEAHDGRLWAAPNRPRGAVFQFSLPAITQ
jgi:light-regulated signal transduction histidine kinase (bacteriophytochrome)